MKEGTRVQGGLNERRKGRMKHKKNERRNEGQDMFRSVYLFRKTFRDAS